MGFKLPSFITGANRQPVETKKLTVQTEDWQKKEKKRIAIAEERRLGLQKQGEAALKAYVSGIEGYAGGLTGEEGNTEETELAQIPDNASDEQRRKALLQAIHNYGKQPKN